MMRAMRASAKYIAMAFVTIPFVFWLVTGQVTEFIAGARDVVLKVNGDVVRLQPFQRQYQAVLEQYRRQQGGGRLTREDEQQIQDRVTEQLIQRILLERAYRRLGITVSDDEIIQAAKSSPPPQLLQQVLQDSSFQTNGQFDITKWQRYLSIAPPEFTAQLEALYREYLPQQKLEEYLTADIYVSDAKLWRLWRDQHELVTVALLALRPNDIPDSLAPVSDAEVVRYYTAHRSDFTQPATAWLSYVAVPRVPDAADTATALARIRRLRGEIASGKAKFEDVAKKESADSGSGARGGDLGWVKRDGAGFDRQFVEGLRRLKPGELSQPVRTRFGFHLIRVDAARGDSLHVRHILVPIVLQGKHLDAVDVRTDTLDRIAAERTDASRLDSAARVLRLPLGHAKLTQGDRLVLGPYAVPDASVWAFEVRPGETGGVIEGEGASYVFRLDSLAPAGVPALAQIRARVVEAARYEKKKAVARAQAEQMARALADATDVLAAGQAHGFLVRKLGPFSRVTAPAEFAREPLVLGAAFGLRPGERTGLIVGETGFFMLQGIARIPADSAAWLKQRERQRAELLRAVAQVRVQQYLAALRAEAKVVDRRKELFHPTASSAG